MSKKPVDIDFHIAAIAHTVPLKARKAVIEGICVILKTARGADTPPTSETAPKVWTEITAANQDLQQIKLQPHAKPLGSPVPLSMKRVSELLPEEVLDRREKDRVRKAISRKHSKKQNSFL